MNQSTAEPQNYPSPWRTSAYIGLVTGLLFLPLCWRITHKELGSDHSSHIKFAIKLAETGQPLPHPLLHYTLLVLSPSDDYTTLSHTAALLYAFCLGVSALFTARILIHAAPQTSPRFLGWLAFAMTIAMALPNWWSHPSEAENYPWWLFYRTYLLQITPNCWHNPTLIFCMPFVLALYWLFIRETEQMTRTSTIWIGVLIAVTTFAKPNYILAFAPIYALHLAWYAFRLPESWQRRLGTGILLQVKAFWLLIPGLWLQFQLLHQITPDKQTMITIQPFAVWEYYVPLEYIPFAVLVGIFFPLVVFCCYPRQVINYLPLQRAWLIFAVSLLQFILFMQSTYGGMDANFFWGTIFTDRILFIMATALVLQQAPTGKRTFCLYCLGLHFLSGFIFTAKCAFLKSSIVLH